MSNNESTYKRIKLQFADTVRKVTYPLASLLYNTKQVALPFEVNEGMHILFMRHDVLGDMITTLPLFRLIKTHYPKTTIHVVATNSNASILDHCDFVDQVHIVPKDILKKPFLHRKYINKLKSINFDIIVNCFTARASQNGILTYQIAGSKSLTAMIDFGERYKCYFNALSALAARESNMWDRMFMLGVEIFGISFKESERVPFVPANQNHKDQALETLRAFDLQPKKFVAINVSAGQPRNRWTDSAYKKLLTALQNSNIQCLLFGVNNDEDLLESLKTTCPGVYSYPFDRELAEIGMALQQSLLSISPDTGFVHLATAAQIPQIIIAQSHGSTANEWSPICSPFKKIIAKDNNYVASIQAEEVIDTTLAFLEEIKTSQITNPWT